MKFTAALAMLSLAGTLAFTAACDTTRPPGAGQADPLARDAYPNVVTHGNLRNRLFIEEETVDYATANRPMRVTVPVRVNDRFDWQAQYKFLFFDDNWRPVGETDWLYAELPARTQVPLSAVAMNRDATRWRLEVRPWELRPRR